MAQYSSHERDQARQRVGTATMGIAILAVGAAGAASVLAWDSTTSAPAAATDRDSTTSTSRTGREDGDRSGDGTQEGGGWSGISGRSDLPPGGIPSAEPPGNGSGGGMVGSHGS